MCIALQIALAVSVVTLHDPDIFGVEPNVIFAIQRLVSGDKLYTNPEQVPFSIVQYTPLYYVLTAKAATLLGLDPREDVWSLYAVARSISLACCLMTAILLYFLCVKALNLHTYAAFVVASLSLIVPSTYGIVARPDSLMHLLMLAAFFCYLKIESVESQTKRYKLLTVSVGLVILAVFAKQTAVQMLLIFGMLSVLQRKWIELALLPVLSLVLCIVTYRVLAGSTPNFHTFYQNIVTGAFACGINLDWTSNILRHFLFTYGLLLSLFLATACVYFTRRERAAYDITSLYVAAVVLLMVFSYATLKYGIAINHAYEAITFMILAVTSFVTRDSEFAAEPSSGRLLSVATIALYISLFSLSQTGQFLYQYHTAWWHRERDWSDIATQEQVVRSLEQELDLHPSSRFFAYWLPYVNLRLFDRCVMPQIEIVGHCTFPGSVFHYNEFNSEIQSRRLNLIVIERGQNLSAFAGVNLERFQPFTAIGRYIILRQED